MFSAHVPLLERQSCFLFANNCFNFKKEIKDFSLLEGKSFKDLPLTVLLVFCRGRLLFVLLLNREQHTMPCFLRS